MVGKLVKQTFAYKQAELASGAKVTTHEVVVQDGKVVMVGGDATVELKVNDVDNSFTFSIYNYGPNGTKTYNTNGVPEGVSAEAIIKEFVAFVEADIV